MKILWVEDERDGPFSGLGLYNGEKVWFRRINGPPLITYKIVDEKMKENGKEEVEGVEKKLNDLDISTKKLLGQDDDDIPEVEKVEERYEEKHYEMELIRLKEEEIRRLEEDHYDFCQKTGAPLFHGDAFRIIRAKTGMEKKDLKNEKVPEGGKFKASFRMMTPMVKVNRNINSLSVEGEVIKCISTKEIENYLVPRRVEVVDEN